MSALWKKTIRESRWLLVGCCALIFAFHYLRVWISSLFSTGNLAAMLSFVPEQFEKLMPVPFSQVATSAGRIAVAYDDPLVLLVMSVWTIARGSDAVAGEINRGTMEMVLAQPVSRLGVLGSQGAVTLGGVGILAVTAWLGTSLGLATVTLEQTVAAGVFVPAALNLFALGVFLAGLTTLVSSGANYRARTIGVVGGAYAVSMVLKVIGRLAPGWQWMSYLSFFTPFEPQLLVSDPDRAWSIWRPMAAGIELGGLGYDAVLVGLGLAGYVGAAVIFARRDLPAPL